GVWVVPGSQLWPQERIQEVLANPSFEKEGMVPAEMEPGDILLHDIMVLHGSDVNRAPSLRRVIYYEFRNAWQILSEGPWDREWITQRLRMLQQAVHERAVHPYASDDVTPAYTPPPGWETGWQPGASVELRVRH
ncbi:MAG: hypothetical protein C4321_07405, partial [Chloroflexota bacterium]